MPRAGSRAIPIVALMLPLIACGAGPAAPTRPVAPVSRNAVNAAFYPDQPHGIPWALLCVTQCLTASLVPAMHHPRPGAATVALVLNGAVQVTGVRATVTFDHSRVAILAFGASEWFATGVGDGGSISFADRGGALEIVAGRGDRPIDGSGEIAWFQATPLFGPGGSATVQMVSSVTGSAQVVAAAIGGTLVAW